MDARTHTHRVWHLEPLAQSSFSQSLSHPADFSGNLLPAVGGAAPANCDGPAIVV